MADDRSQPGKRDAAYRRIVKRFVKDPKLDSAYFELARFEGTPEAVLNALRATIEELGLSEELRVGVRHFEAGDQVEVYRTPFAPAGTVADEAYADRVVRRFAESGLVAAQLDPRPFGTAKNGLRMLEAALERANLPHRPGSFRGPTAHLRNASQLDLDDGENETGATMGQQECWDIVSQVRRMGFRRIELDLDEADLPATIILHALDGIDQPDPDDGILAEVAVGRLTFHLREGHPDPREVKEKRLQPYAEQVWEFLQESSALGPITPNRKSNLGSTYLDVRSALDRMGVGDLVRASIDFDGEGVVLVRQPTPNSFEYAVVEVVHTDWGGVYVYADGSLVDVIEADEAEPTGVALWIDDYGIDTRMLRVFELGGPGMDVLPDEFSEIPEAALLPGTLDFERWCSAGD